jgi:hypothetical protein
MEVCYLGTLPLFQIFWTKAIQFSAGIQDSHPIV